jgi:NADH dehydrogenase
MEVVRSLKNEPVEVLLLDRHNYHTFQPLLYQVATAGLEPEDIAWSVRDVFQNQSNFSFRMATVTDVNLDDKQIEVSQGEPIGYDYLIMAAGAETDYFGVDGAEEHSIPVKDLTNAIKLRGHILSQFEAVEKNTELIDRGALNFVIIGGGPTGVETAGALVELFDKVLQKDYPNLDVDRARVILLEMKPHLLEPYDSSLRDYTLETLRNRGVEVKLEESVTKAKDDHIELESGDTIPTQTLIWAAGVRANPLADQLNVDQTQGGRVDVNDDLSLPGHPEAFVIGDMAGSRDEAGNLHPQLAPVAIQGARHVSQQILKLEAGDDSESFVYDNPGKMATVGVNAAVAELPGGLKLSGFLAWVIWVFLHIMKLVGFRNRVLVFFDWVYNYFTYNRASRLILNEFDTTFSMSESEENVPIDD